MEIVSIANIKGGVGKTTLSILLARYLALTNKNVLVIDADPQGTASLHLYNILERNKQGYLLKGLHNLLKPFIKGRAITTNMIQKNIAKLPEPKEESFLLLPNCIESSEYDLVLRERGIQESFMDNIISSIDIDLDYIIIDCPPYVNAFLQSALAVSDSLIIPCETSLQAYPGVVKVFSLLKKYKNWKMCSIKKVIAVPTKVQRTIESQNTLELLKEQLKDKVTKHVLPYSVLVNRVFGNEMTIQKIIKSEDKDRENVKQTIHDVLEELTSFLEK